MKQPAKWYDNVFRHGEYWNEKSHNFHKLWDKIWELTEGDNILDIGCGPGLFLKRMPRGVHYTGIDFSTYAVEQVLKAGYPALLMDLENQTPDYTGFDCVVLCEVLEHIQNDQALMESISGGVCIVGSVPMFDDDSHVRFFTSIQQVMDRYGLDIDSYVFQFENRIIFKTWK